MSFRLPLSATIAVIYLVFSMAPCRFALAAGALEDLSHNGTQPGLICLPFGTCEPCPEEYLPEPYCRPFGNRRLVHCVNATTAVPTQGEQSGTPHATDGQGDPRIPESLNHEGPTHPEGEIIAWESCGRISDRERADFYEFIACNVLFAAISLVVLFVRSKRLQAIQARQLAARIGLVRR